MKAVPLALALCVLTCNLGHAADCRDDRRQTRLAIGSQVEEIYAVELDLLRRLMGRRQPAYGGMASRLLDVIDTIYPPEAAAAEANSRRCRNFIPPVRRICRDAASTLDRALTETALGRLSEATRVAYGSLMGRCELYLGIPRRMNFLRMPSEQ